MQSEEPEAVLPPLRAPNIRKKFHEHHSVRGDNELVASFSFCRHSLHKPRIWRCHHIETRSLFLTSTHRHHPIVPIPLYRQKSVDTTTILSWVGIEKIVSRPKQTLNTIGCRDRRMRAVLYRTHQRGQVHSLTSAVQGLYKHLENR